MNKFNFYETFRKNIYRQTIVLFILLINFNRYNLAFILLNIFLNPIIIFIFKYLEIILKIQRSIC